MKKILCLIFLILFIQFSAANEITYNIIGDKVLVQIQSNETQTIFLPEEYSTLELNSQKSLENNTLITNASKISFITRNFIKKTDKEYIFVVKNLIQNKANITLYLPENYVISNNLSYPKNYSLSTNGKNIIITWENIEDEEIIVFYKGVEKSNFVVYLIILFSLSILFLLYYLQKKHFEKKLKQTKEKTNKIKNKLKEKEKESKTKNLFGDEKKIVNYLMKKKNNECWTKELVKELGIPKVRVSRKIRSLSEKGILSKEKFGNENRIILNK